MTIDLQPNSVRKVLRPTDFASWRSRLDREQLVPVIAVAGSRGKTSVIRVVESILREGHVRFASWTNTGVEIEGEMQRGELGPWSRALTRLSAGGLDLALQELDWATVQALGSRSATFPVFAVANLCVNSEACLLTPEINRARRALDRIRASTSASSRLILNADDFAVSAENSIELADRFLIGISPDTPVLRRHLRRGGDACWIEDSTVVLQEDGQTHSIVDTRRLHWTQGGMIPFAVQSALLATAITRSCGLDHRLIATGLTAHNPRPELMPGAFNVFEIGSSRIVIDRPMPSWFLRMSLRATANLGAGRQIHTVGPMAGIDTNDMIEIGRLLGRGGGALILHGDWAADRLGAIRQGAATNEVPPIVLLAADERSAIQQGIDMLRPRDVLLVLAEDAPAAIRLIARRIRREPSPSRDSVGAA